MAINIDDCLISIVTATLDRRHFLEAAIKSVATQGLENIEHIIIDGQSKDGTLEMLDNFPHLKIISEQDKNLYDAWNKGIALAKGRFILILNSDDQLANGALEELRKLTRGHPYADLISGPVELERDLLDAPSTVHIIDDKRMLKLREQDIGPGIPLTNGRIISRRLFDRVGLFDTRYPIISDRQFFLRVLLEKPNNIITQTPLYRYHVHAGSLTLNDQAPSFNHIQECQDAALDGMRLNQSSESKSAYRRWNAWTTFYRAYMYLRSGQGLKAIQVIGNGLSVDPIWFFRVLPMLWRHVCEKEQRRGRLIA